MWAVEIMLTQKDFQLASCGVRALSDNISVVFYLNKQGRTRSRRLKTVSKRVFRLTESLDIVLKAAHICGEHNVLAEILFRQQMVLKHEWRLGRPTVLRVSRMNPGVPPTIDLFANEFNTQLPLYMSSCLNSLALMMSQWPLEVFMLSCQPPSCNLYTLNSCRSVCGLFCLWRQLLQQRLGFPRSLAGRRESF